MKKWILAAAAAAALAACAPPAPKAPAAPETPAPVALKVPSGDYKMEQNHRSLRWSIVHMGLSNFNARFDKFDSDLKLDAANPSASSIKFTVDLNSLSTSYNDKFLVTHKGSPFKSYEEEIYKGFLGADKQPQATFTSTSFKLDGADKGTVTGDLSLNGVTKPVTFAVTLVGQNEKHPFSGGPAIGLSATGAIKRSEFNVAQEGFLKDSLSDDVTVTFDGEFDLVPAPAPAAPAPAKK